MAITRKELANSSIHICIKLSVDVFICSPLTIFGQKAMVHVWAHRRGEAYEDITVIACLHVCMEGDRLINMYVYKCICRSVWSTIAMFIMTGKRVGPTIGVHLSTDPLSPTTHERMRHVVFASSHEHTWKDTHMHTHTHTYKQMNH